MTVAEVNRRTGLTRAALRLYEKLGLVRPVGRTGGGYRLTRAKLTVHSQRRRYRAPPVDTCRGIRRVLRYSPPPFVPMARTGGDYL